MSSLWQKILSFVDIDGSATTEELGTNLEDTLKFRNFGGSVDQLTAMIKDGGEAVPADLYLARGCIHMKLHNYDLCFHDAQQAVRLDRHLAVAYHLAFLALKELNELVKALAFLCKYFSLMIAPKSTSSSQLKRDYSAVLPGCKSEQLNGKHAEYSAERKLHSQTKTALLGEYPRSQNMLHLLPEQPSSIAALRKDLFDFSLLTLQHVPDAMQYTSASGAPADLAGVLLIVAKTLAGKGQQELAVYVFEAVVALCRGQSDDGVVKTLMPALEGLARCHIALVCGNRALAVLARYHTLAQQVQCFQEVANAAVLQAKAHEIMGNLQLSEQCLLDRLDILMSMDDGDEQCRAVMEARFDLSQLCQRRSRLRAAVQHAEKALQAGRELHDRQALMRSHLLLGKLHMLLGVYPQSAWHFKTALTVARKGMLVNWQAHALLGLGQLYLVLERFRSAVEQLQALLSLNLEENSAVVGDGKEIIEGSEFRCRALLLLGRAQYALHHPQNAAGFLDEACLEAEQQSARALMAEAQCWAGVVAGALGSELAGRTKLQAAFEGAESIGDKVLVMNCHYRLGSLYAKATDSKYFVVAEEHLYAAIELFTELRATHGSYMPSRGELFDLPLDCFESLQALLVDRGATKDALVIAEAAQQRAFLDMAVLHQDTDELHVTRSLPVKVSSYEEIVKRISEDSAVVLFYSFVHDSLFIWLLFPRRGLVKFHRWPPNAVRFLLPFLRQNYFLLSRLPAVVRDVGRMCEARSCCLVGGQSTMFRSAAAGQCAEKQGDPPPYCPYGSIAQRHQLAYPWVGDDELLHPGRASYLAAPAPADEAIGTESRASMRDLYDVLALPFEKQLFPLSNSSPVRDMVLVLQGNLMLCPFSALVTSRRLVMCDFFQVRVMPCLMMTRLHSMSHCEVCQADADAPTDCLTALVAGNPLIPSVMFFGQTWRPLPLPFAEREARSIALLIGSNVQPVIGGDATRRRLLAELPKANLVHLALHMSWELCALIAGPDDSSSSVCEQDVLITPSTISRLHMRAKLVVLSGGCSYAHGQQAPAALPPPGQHNLPSPASLTVMARSFLLAGAKCVVMCLWSIPDRATDEMMFMFYENLKRGLSVSRSLRETMEIVRARRGFTEPVHWASFLHFGDDVRIEFGNRDVGTNSSSASGHVSRNEPLCEEDEESAGEGVDCMNSDQPVGNHLAASVDLSAQSRRSAKECRNAFVRFLMCLRSSDSEAITDLLLKVTELCRMALKSVQRATETQLTSSPSQWTLSALSADSRECQSVLEHVQAHQWGRVLLGALGFIFLSKGDEEEGVDLPNSVQYKQAIESVLDIAQKIYDMAAISPVNVLAAFMATLPLEGQSPRGVVYVLKHPWERLPVDSDQLCGAWQVESLQTLLKVLGFDVELDNESIDIRHVLVLQEDACREAIHIAVQSCMEEIAYDERSHSDNHDYESVDVQHSSGAWCAHSINESSSTQSLVDFLSGVTPVEAAASEQTPAERSSSTIQIPLPSHRRAHSAGQIAIATGSSASPSQLHHHPNTSEGHNSRSISSQSEGAQTSPSSLPSSYSTHLAGCEQCHGRFGVLRKRYCCSFCLRVLCRSCYKDTTASVSPIEFLLADKQRTDLCTSCERITALQAQANMQTSPS